MDIQIIYEDDYLAIIDKPAGLLSEGGTDSVLAQFDTYLKSKYPFKKNWVAGLPHRLDKPVGGLMICTKKKSVLSELSGQVKSPWDKYYWAIVNGEYNGPKKCTHYHKKSDKQLQALISDVALKDFKKIEISVKVLEIKDGKSKLEIKLNTGKYHQIRAQLAHMGYPILGDSLYNMNEGNVPLKIELISKRINFFNIYSNQQLSIESTKDVRF